MQKKCKKFIVYDAGLVINPSFPYFGASPDGKVYDPTEKDPFGLMEIKNPYYIDINEIPGFLLLLKNHIFTARSECIIFIFHM